MIGILRDLGTAWQEIAAQQRQAQSQGKAAASAPRRSRGPSDDAAGELLREPLGAILAHGCETCSEAQADALSADDFDGLERLDVAARAARRRAGPVHAG